MGGLLEWTTGMPFAVALFVLYLVIIVIVFATLADRVSPEFKRFFHWGPGTKETPIKFAGISIDTKAKYAGFAGVLVFQALLMTYAGSIIQQWYQWEIMDPKNMLLSQPKWLVWAFDFVIDVVGLITSNLTFFVAIATQQFQFAIISWFAGWLPANFFMYLRIRDKVYNPAASARVQRAGAQALVRMSRKKALVRMSRKKARWPGAKTARLAAP
jgi:hypothetical protein